MSIKKPVPTIVTSLGRRCPVCGNVSYSRSGTHPQCAANNADAKMRAVLKRRKAR